jgi:ADP-ribosylglycohydrolase
MAGDQTESAIAARAIASFQALAIGDAIGKQTETLSRAAVLQWYPGGITGFQGRPGDVIPRYAGKGYEWRIGETTDDTEQTLAVARALLLEGPNHTAVARQLLQCRKSLHPGVSLWKLAQSGDPDHIESDGDGCGAAMRVAPIGVLYPSTSLPAIIRASYECAIPTHGGPLAIAGASAVAAAVSAALEGRSTDYVLALALEASKGAMADSIERTYADLRSSNRLAVDEIAHHHFPDHPLKIVPLAIALALRTESAEETALIAANLGGDADSVASIGSAIAGALWPDTVNRSWRQVLSDINLHDLGEVATALAARRKSPLA